MRDVRPHPNRECISARAAFVLAIVYMIFAGIGAIGLVGPDEPRYAWIARAMARTGDWVTPRLYGRPWFEKPALYYWGAACGFALHLPAEWAARLPSAIAALSVAITIGWLAWKHYGKGVEVLLSPTLLAPMLFSASVAAIGFARSAAPDMLLSASLTLAMASAASVLRNAGALRGAADAASRGRARGVSPLLLFGSFLGLAVLAKGPAAILLAGGAIGVWAIATRKWHAALRLAHPLALGAFCVVALPWYVLCALRNPGFLRVFLFQHNFERYLTPEFGHRQPLWFFIPVVLVALLPWTPLLWPVTRQALRLYREKTWRDSPEFYFACWAVFPIMFFSFSESKLPGYILPSVPAIALLMGLALARTFEEQSPAERRILALTAAAIGLVWIAMGLAARPWLNHLSPGVHDAMGPAILVSSVVAIAGGAAIAIPGLLRRRAWFFVSFLLVVLLMGIATRTILPRLDPYVSARWYGNFLRDDLHPDRIFTFRLNRSWSYGLNFYLDRELPEWLPSDPEAALVLTTPQGLEEMRRLGRVRGELNEPESGILCVPVYPAPRPR